jgi:hypothetical protein
MTWVTSRPNGTIPVLCAMPSTGLRGARPRRQGRPVPPRRELPGPAEARGARRAVASVPDARVTPVGVALAGRDGGVAVGAPPHPPQNVANRRVCRPPGRDKHRPHAYLAKAAGGRGLWHVLPVVRRAREAVVGRDHLLVRRSHPLPLEGTGVEIQHPDRPSSETGVARERSGVAREDPGPRGKIQERVCHGLIASSGNHRRSPAPTPRLTPRSITRRYSSSPRETRHRQLAGARQLARDRRDFGDLPWQENDAVDPTAPEPQPHPTARPRTRILAEQHRHASSPPEREYRRSRIPRAWFTGYSTIWLKVRRSA